MTPSVDANKRDFVRTIRMMNPTFRGGIRSDRFAFAANIINQCSRRISSDLSVQLTQVFGVAYVIRVHHLQDVLSSPGEAIYYHEIRSSVSVGAEPSVTDYSVYLETWLILSETSNTFAYFINSHHWAKGTHLSLL